MRFRQPGTKLRRSWSVGELCILAMGAIALSAFGYAAFDSLVNRISVQQTARTDDRPGRDGPTALGPQHDRRTSGRAALGAPFESAGEDVGAVSSPPISSSNPAPPVDGTIGEQQRPETRPRRDRRSGTDAADRARSAERARWLENEWRALAEALAEGEIPDGSGSTMLEQVLDGLGFYPAGARVQRAPNATELPTAHLNDAYCTTLGSLPPDGSSTISIVAGFVPRGLILNTSTGALCGTPGETGIFRFVTEQINTGPMGSGGFTTRIAYRLVVTEDTANTSEGELTIVTSQLATGTVGAEYTFQLEARGGEGSYRWSATGLPDGIELDSGSGLLGGSPAKSGESPILFSVTDTAGTVATRELILTVRTTPVFITSRTLGEGVVGEAFQARLAAQGGIPPYRWELSGAPLPEGLSFVPASGVIEGVPEKAFEGSLTARVIDSDQKSDLADLPLEIREHALRIVTTSLGDGFVGTPFERTLLAEGGTAPYTWSMIGGSLPSGLTLEPSGTVTGTPTEPSDGSITVLVEDVPGAQTSRQLRLRIQRLQPEQTPTPIPTPEPTPAEPGSGGTPIDPTPTPTPTLPPVSELLGIPSDRAVGLVWKNPAHTDFVGVTVVRTEGAPAASVTEGTTIYSGDATNTLDSTVVVDHTYSYVAFARYRIEQPVGTPPAVIVTPRTLSLSGKPDPFVDRVAAFAPLDPSCFGCGSMPGTVFGPPHGSGELNGAATDIVSLGAKVNSDSSQSPPYGGTITLEFTDNIVTNGAGPDFTIFENPFRLVGTDQYFIEPAVVEVSVDGERFYRFPFDFVPHYNGDGSLNLFNPFCYAEGFAGVKPVYSNNNVPSPLNTALAGGDSFDLSDLPGTPLSWIRFIRITGTGDGWLADDQNDLVRQSNDPPFFGASGRGNSGFDLDAAVGLH